MESANVYIINQTDRFQRRMGLYSSALTIEIARIPNLFMSFYNGTMDINSNDDAQVRRSMIQAKRAAAKDPDDASMYGSDGRLKIVSGPPTRKSARIDKRQT